jgi:hypothetical protein
VYDYQATAKTASQCDSPRQSIAIGQASNSITPEREPQIADQLRVMENEIQYQRDVMGILFARLQPVLAPATPDANSEKANEPTCQLASVLSRFSSAIRSNSAGISEILRRLEV